MVYTCQSKCCHYTFWCSKPQRICPDCGKSLVRPATAAERAAYCRRRTPVLPQRRCSG